jgi:hypothetical protein
VYLIAAVISSLIQSLPSGTAYCIGIVLIVMETGRLMQHKGSLARAALPGVAADDIRHATRAVGFRSLKRS